MATSQDYMKKSRRKIKVYPTTTVTLVLDHWTIADIDAAASKANVSREKWIQMGLDYLIEVNLGMNAPSYRAAEPDRQRLAKKIDRLQKKSEKRCRPKPRKSKKRKKRSAD